MSQAQILPTEHFSPSVSLIEGRPATTSLAIAEHFGKRHAHVMRDIRNLYAELPEEERRPKFGLTSRTVAGPNNSERQEEFFIVYFDGFILLVMGYTGKRALQIKLLYIAAFNVMRDELAAQREVALPEVSTSDTLTPEQQAQLQAIVQAKMGMLPKAVQRKAYKEVWSRFNNNFQIARYAQLPPAKMGEAVEYLVGMEVKAASALPCNPGSNLEQNHLPPVQTFRADFPGDMGSDRKEAMQRMERIAREMHTGLGVVRNIVRLGCHPGSKTMRMRPDEREAYEILHNLYVAADESLCAAYNALEAGYKLGRLYGRG